jgi:hypothetical protein
MNTEIIDRLTDAPRFTRVQAAAALHESRNVAARHAAIRVLIVTPGTRSGRLGEIVTLLRTDPNPTIEDAPQDDISADVYAVEVNDPFGDGDAAWTTVINGRTDRQYFTGDNARWIAILHALAVLHGGPDSHATGAEYAARVLNIPRD